MKGAIQRQSIWCAGLFGLSRSTNQTNETCGENQMNQIPATRREMGPDTFSCSTARDSCAPFANVLESGASSSCPVGCFRRDVVRGDVTNLNRVDPLLGQDVRDDHDLVPDLKLFSVLQDPERRLQSLFRVRTEIDLERKDTAVEHHGPSRLAHVGKGVDVGRERTAVCDEIGHESPSGDHDDSLGLDPLGELNGRRRQLLLISRVAQVFCKLQSGYRLGFQRNLAQVFDTLHRDTSQPWFPRTA